MQIYSCEVVVVCFFLLQQLEERGCAMILLSEQNDLFDLKSVCVCNMRENSVYELSLAHRAFVHRQYLQIFIFILKGTLTLCEYDLKTSILILLI